jgi:hypothetical protein
MTIELSGGHRALPLDNPLELLDDRSAGLRAELLRVSNTAFGRDTSLLWKRKFSADFLGPLSSFYLIRDSVRNLIGWSGYRTAVLDGHQIVYFTSTGLVPSAQGHGLGSAFLTAVISAVAESRPSAPVATVVRTRNPHSYQLARKTFGPEIFPRVDGYVPAHRHTLMAAIASWLGFAAFDPSTGRVTGAYSDDLYGDQPRTEDVAVDRLFATLGRHDAFLICACRSPTIQSPPNGSPLVGAKRSVADTSSEI